MPKKVLIFVRSTKSIEKLDPLKYLFTDDFSPIQFHIVTSRIKGSSYSQIQWKDKVLYNRQISQCLKYSVMGFKWEEVNANGSKPYLCTFDLNTLIDDALEAFDHGTPFDTYELIDRAFEIRQERISNGIKFINLTKSEALASQLLQKV